MSETKSRVITGAPVGWTIYEFDNVATDDDIKEWIGTTLHDWDGKLHHSQSIPIYRWFRLDHQLYLVVEREEQAGM